MFALRMGKQPAIKQVSEYDYGITHGDNHSFSGFAPAASNESSEEYQRQAGGAYPDEFIVAMAQVARDVCHQAENQNETSKPNMDNVMFHYWLG